jgi:hypothetical protein
MLLQEKQLLSFSLPLTTHFAEHNLDQALEPINPSQLSQEQVVMAVQKVARTRAQYKVEHLPPCDRESERARERDCGTGRHSERRRETQ